MGRQVMLGEISHSRADEDVLLVERLLKAVHVGNIDLFVGSDAAAAVDGAA